MTHCPMDCAVADVRRSQVKPSDWPWLGLLLFPYRCRSCNTRFYSMPSSVAGTLTLVVLIAIAYPATYIIGRQFEDNSLVQQIYWPLEWVIGRVRDFALAAR